MELIYTLEEIDRVAKTLLKEMAAYKVFLFSAEMGSGKTTLIKSICAELGVTDNVSSPTFSIINEYRGSNDNIIYHLDLYRLKDSEEAQNAGVEECIYSENICFIEWPEIALSLMPDNCITVNISTLKDGRRKLTVVVPAHLADIR